MDTGLVIAIVLFGVGIVCANISIYLLQNRVAHLEKHLELTLDHLCNIENSKH